MKQHRQITANSEMSFSRSSSAPLILTLKLDNRTFTFFNQLRQQHFPPNRNFLPAHVTLFHALPETQKTTIEQTLHRICSDTPILSLRFPRLRFLGQGVAIEVDCPELLQLRQQLANIWHDQLSRQDRQGYRPHVTVQNKVTAEVARQLYDELTIDWHPLQGRGEGLLLWSYQGGPWEWVGEFAFQPI